MNLPLNKTLLGMIVGVISSSFLILDIFHIYTLLPHQITDPWAKIALGVLIGIAVSSGYQAWQQNQKESCKEFYNDNNQPCVSIGCLNFFEKDGDCDIYLFRDKGKVFVKDPDHKKRIKQYGRNAMLVLIPLSPTFDDTDPCYQIMSVYRSA